MIEGRNFRVYAWRHAKFLYMHKNLLDHKNGCDQSAKVVHEEYEEGTR